MKFIYYEICIICDDVNPQVVCDGCGCLVCDKPGCLKRTDGYQLCGMCAYEKQKSVQDK